MLKRRELRGPGDLPVPAAVARPQLFFAGVHPGEFLGGPEPLFARFLAHQALVLAGVFPLCPPRMVQCHARVRLWPARAVQLRSGAALGREAPEHHGASNETEPV